MNDVLHALWSAFWTFLGWLWTALQIVFAVPGLGYVAQVLFFGACGWLIYKAYRLLPYRVRSMARNKVFPYVSMAVDPLRWYLAALIAPGPFIRPGEAGTKVIEKEVVIEVPVRMRRSFREWLLGGIRWGVAYALAYAAFLNWNALWPHLSRFML